MRSAYEALDEAMVALGLQRDLFADVIGVSLGDLDRVQRGDAEARQAALRGAAEVFGLEVAELLGNGVAGRASTTMLRSFVDHAPDTAFAELVRQGVHRELGRFVRHVRRKAWLREALGEPDRGLLSGLGAEPRPIGEGSRPPHGADALAMEVRAQLGLGDEPIPSMLGLTRDRLGIEVQFTETLWGRIDGASVSTGPLRGVLVNLSEGGHRWWRTRTTLAHELCHLLFDGGAFAGARSGGLLIFSPAARHASSAAGGYEPRFGHSHGHFLKIEQRANAFAAYFLAPPTGVQALFGAAEPPRTRATVARLAHHFGLSALTAINVLKNVYGWSDQDRSDLIDDAEGLELDRDHLDVIGPGAVEDAGLRILAEAAVEAGILLGSTRDRWLGLAVEAQPVEPLPEPEAGEPEQVAGEMRQLQLEAKIDAALRLLWDSMDAWIDAGDLTRCRRLVEALPPADVDGNVMVSLLAATARAPELVEVRAAYRREARRVLLERGRPPADVDALFGAGRRDDP